MAKSACSADVPISHLRSRPERAPPTVMTRAWSGLTTVAMNHLGQQLVLLISRSTKHPLYSDSRTTQLGPSPSQPPNPVLPLSPLCLDPRINRIPFRLQTSPSTPGTCGW